MLGQYLINVLIWLDQGANVVFLGGSPDETISARAYREHRPRLERVINWLSGDDMHCRDAYINEQARRQMPREYQRG